MKKQPTACIGCAKSNTQAHAERPGFESRNQYIALRIMRQSHGSSPYAQKDFRLSNFGSGPFHSGNGLRNLMHRTYS